MQCLNLDWNLSYIDRRKQGQLLDLQFLLEQVLLHYPVDQMFLNERMNFEEIFNEYFYHHRVIEQKIDAYLNRII